MKKNIIWIIGIVFSLTALTLAACGGGGDSGPPAPPPADPVVTDPTPPPTPDPTTPEFSGFDFSLQTGNFWEFRWDYYKQNWAQGSSTTTVTDTGRFWVVLGAPTTIAGKTAYAVSLYGKTKNTDKTFAPRWKYLAMADNVMYGSTDGVALSPIFDAQTGTWPGGGFIASFGSSSLITAQSGTVSNDYMNTTAIKVERSSSQSQCQYFPGVGTICGDSSYTYQEKEYFKGGLGPLAYEYYNSYTDCGGGFCSGGTRDHHLGLTASSFSGNVLPFKQEQEDWGKPVSAQVVSRGNVIIGKMKNADFGTTVNIVIGGQAHSPYIEDWYKLTLSSTTTVTLTLSFEESPTADLDLYLMPDIYTLKGYSVADNPATQDAHERIKMSLAAGTYLIAVDGYSMPAGDVDYTLEIE